MRIHSVQILFTSLAGIALAACVSAPAATAAGLAPVHVNMANDRFEITTPAQLCGTVLVADGIVSGYVPSHWNTGDGARPAQLSEVDLIRAGYTIVTPIHLVQMTAEHDRRTTPTKEYVVAGGSVGQDTWRDSSFPRPGVGHRFVMVFVPTQVPGGTFTQAALTLYEAFPVDSSDMVTLQPQTIEQGQVSQSEVKISFFELRSDLTRCT